VTPPDPVALALILARILEHLGVRYCIGGSVASSVYGEVRTTLDVDIVADLDSEGVDAFVAAVESDFHVADEAVRRAVRERSSFNLIHDETLVKADFYVPPDDPVHRGQLARSRRVALRSEPGSEVLLASPEDVVIHKLRWYEMGERVSDRQWRCRGRAWIWTTWTVRRPTWALQSCWPARGWKRASGTESSADAGSTPAASTSLSCLQSMTYVHFGQGLQ